MYKLLIADDEPLEREGLELMIQKCLPNQFQIFHAENGRLAIQQMEKHQPEIIFMDLKMPGIQGIEAIEEIKKQNPKTKIIILTAYDYFSYAKEAIELGVCDYILKPAKKEKIADVLKKCMSEIEEEVENREKELEMKEKLGHLFTLSESECALMIMMDAVSETDVNELLSLLKIPQQTCVTLVIEFSNIKMGERQYLYQLAKRFMKNKVECLCSPLIENRMTIFAFPSDVDMTRNQWITLTMKWMKEIEKRTNKKMKIGIGNCQKDIKEWKKSYQEALLAVKSQPYFGRVKHFSEVEIIQHSEKKEEITYPINSENSNGLEIALQFISDHFHEDITLEEVAQLMNFHPHYFSKWFKKETGQTFSDYLTHKRIEKAKELMKQNDLHVKEISYHVGYNDPNYFSRVFKKVTNMTPKEYRNQLQKN